MSTNFVAVKNGKTLEDVRRVVEARGWVLEEKQPGAAVHFIRDAAGNHLWVQEYDSLFSFDRFGRNRPEAILSALTDDLGLEIVSEHDGEEYDRLVHVDEEDEPGEE